MVSFAIVPKYFDYQNILTVLFFHSIVLNSLTIKVFDVQTICLMFTNWAKLIL